MYGDCVAGSRPTHHHGETYFIQRFHMPWSMCSMVAPETKCINNSWAVVAVGTHVAICGKGFPPALFF